MIYCDALNRQISAHLPVIKSVAGNSAYIEVQEELTKEFHRLREHYEAPPMK